MQQRSHLLRGLSRWRRPIRRIAFHHARRRSRRSSTDCPGATAHRYRQRRRRHPQRAALVDLPRGRPRAHPTGVDQHDVAPGGQRPPVVVRAEFHTAGSARGAPQAAATPVPDALDAGGRDPQPARPGEPFVYAYYDGSTRSPTSTTRRVLRRGAGLLSTGWSIPRRHAPSAPLVITAPRARRRGPQRDPARTRCSPASTTSRGGRSAGCTPPNARGRLCSPPPPSARRGPGS